MVGLGAKSSLLAIVLAVTLFAGCVGDDEVGADSEVTETTDSGSGTGGAKTSGDGSGGGTKKSGSGSDATDKEKDAAKAGCQFTFCIEGHVYAPVWDVGMTWTYDITGSYYTTTDYSATVGVFKVNEDHFLMGTDSETELTNSVTGHYGVMTGQVQKDSYGVLEHEAYQDLLGFLKIEDTTWKAKLWDTEFTLVKEPAQEITHAKGKSLGIRVNGASEVGDTLLVEYASDVAWLTKLEWKGADGELQLAYTLSDYSHASSTSGFKIWDTTDWTSVGGLGNAAPTSALARWIVGGQASFVLLHVVTQDPISVAQARAIKPSGQIEEFSHDGPQSEIRVTGFEVGDWFLHSLSDRGKASDPTSQAQMVIFGYVVVERAA